MADQQKIAVITGAARNPATNLTCYRLIARGWRVVALDSPRPGTPDSIEVELSDRDAVKKAVDDTAGGLGPISLLIAGGLFYDVVPFAEVTPQEWRRYFDGHLGHAVNTCWAVAPHMIEAGGGTIVLVSSEFAIDGPVEDWWAAHYASAKGGILGLQRSLAAELGPRGIRVTGVGPGPSEKSYPGITATDAYRWSLPLRRRQTIEETVETLLFMAEEATFCAGNIVSNNAGAVI